MTVAIVSALLVSAGACGDDEGDESAGSPTTESSDEAGDAVSDDSLQGPEAPAPPPTVPLDELEAALAAAVASGDLCRFTAVFAEMSPDYSDEATRSETQRVIDESFAAIAPAAPPEIAAAVATLVEQTEAAYAVLDRNGGDRSDPEYTDIATSPEMSDAQLDFRAWIGETCDPSG